MVLTLPSWVRFEDEKDSQAGHNIRIFKHRVVVCLFQNSGNHIAKGMN